MLVFLSIAILAASFGGYWTWALVRQARRARDDSTADPALTPGVPAPRLVLVGVVTDFLDTLGIGSFAITTTLYRWWKLVPDRVIPGTLNVGHALPTVVQAAIYIAIIEVELETLVVMIAASMAGAMLGAGVVARWDTYKVRTGMAFALLGAAALLLARLLNLLPGGGELKALSGIWLAIGGLGNFVLGALMTIGIGLYAPCMILVAVLGMSPKVAFPIMMGSCAFLMGVASVRFIRLGSYDAKAALGLTLGGVPAVLVAAFVVKELPLDWVRGLVVIVVIYTAIGLLRDRRSIA
jgi:uncharacterized membrane protein YfcA